jgi:hypothetical protein
MRRPETLAFNVRIPDLTGDYEKDKSLLLNFMKEANLKIRVLEDELRKEMQKNVKKGI